LHNFPIYVKQIYWPHTCTLFQTIFSISICLLTNQYWRDDPPTNTRTATNIISDIDTSYLRNIWHRYLVFFNINRLEKFKTNQMKIIELSKNSLN
jgi:hypothetical protein